MPAMLHCLIVVSLLRRVQWDRGEVNPSTTRAVTSARGLCRLERIPRLFAKWRWCGLPSYRVS